MVTSFVDEIICKKPNDRTKKKQKSLNDGYWCGLWNFSRTYAYVRQKKKAASDPKSERSIKLYHRCVKWKPVCIWMRITYKIFSSTTFPFFSPFSLLYDKRTVDELICTIHHTLHKHIGIRWNWMNTSTQSIHVTFRYLTVFMLIRIFCLIKAAYKNYISNWINWSTLIGWVQAILSFGC